MKRDMELVRRLMLAIEAQPAGARVTGADLLVDGDDDTTVAEHLHMLIDHGFLKGTPDRAIAHRKSPLRVHIHGITWKGHEFLDAVRDDTIWNKTKDKVASVGGSATVEIVTQVATGFIKQMLGLTV